MMGNAETAMNLIGLILIAALSGGIVAVSLRLRVSASSGRLRLDGEGPREDDRHPSRTEWLQDAFGLKREAGIYRAVKDQIGR